MFRINRYVAGRAESPDPRLKVLVIVGHPRSDSFCGALADAFCEGALVAGTLTERLNLADLDFDPDVHTPSPNNQPLEEDLSRAWALVHWADHLVFVYPTWWGGVPALLKGFLDRLMRPGFAFTTCEGGIGYEGMLTGRSAQLITTMDTPPLAHKLLYREPGRNAMARATLSFCGVRPVRYMALGSVKSATAAQRKAWLIRARCQGQQLAKGQVTRVEKIKHKTGTWLRALRLQFYPMTWIAYTMGALAAAAGGGVFSSSVFWVGYLCLFLLEVATVLINEVVDRDTDSKNRFYSTFTGGSRVLVDGSLSLREAIVGIGVSLAGFAISAGILFVMLPATAVLGSLGVLGILAVLAITYTAPPFKLSYRGLGELDVGITHSIGVLLCGYLFLGGSWTNGMPWLLSLPLFFAILPSIILSGIPDLDADAAAGKRTLAVRFGISGALKLAGGFTLLSAMLAVTWQLFGVTEGAYAGVAYVAVPHASWLYWLLRRRILSDRHEGRMDGLMVVSLAYVLWFGLVPLFGLI